MFLNVNSLNHRVIYIERSIFTNDVHSIKNKFFSKPLCTKELKMNKEILIIMLWQYNKAVFMLIFGAQCFLKKTTN